MKHAFNRFLIQLLASSLLFGLAVQPAHATKKNKEATAQKRIQQMQQKFDQEKAALEQANTELQTKAEAAGKESEEKLAKQQQAASRLQAASKAELEALKKKSASDNETSLAKIAELEARLQQTADTLSMTEAQRKQLEREKNQLQTELSGKGAELSVCEVKNGNLIKLSTELMNKYEKEALKTVDPFFGIAGVAIENNFQAKREEAESMRFNSKK